MDVVWIPVVIVLVAIGVFAGVRIFGGERRDLVGEAKARASDVREAAEAALAVELQTLDQQRRELEEIKVIEDTGERLQALADYANRRRAK